MMDIRDLRQDYCTGELRREGLAADPFCQFANWFREASTCAGIVEPNAMTAATAGNDGRVTVRTVLLKGWDENGFVFFTNYLSKKSLQIAENPHVALLFSWLPQARQISITGRAKKVPRDESLAYFSSRPEASQIGTWASEQGKIIASREILETQFETFRKKFAGTSIPLPDFWGGYRVVPETMEFWQGRSSRLHDRFLYTREEPAGWRIERLSP